MYYELGAYIHVVPNMILPCRLLYLFKCVNRLQIASIGIHVFNSDSAEEELKYSLLELNLARACPLSFPVDGYINYKRPFVIINHMYSI